VKRSPEASRASPDRDDSPAALQKPRQPGRIRAFILAAAVHAAFFALIVFGVTWQSSPTAPLVAELWDKLPPAAKPEPPKPEPPKPEPPEPPKPEPEPPKPEPEPKKAEPPKPEPPKPAVKPEPPKPDPAIAEKAAREKREKEKRDRLEREKEEKHKAEEAKKKREQEEAAKKKQEDERKRREEEARKREAEKARTEAAARRQSEVDKYINDIRNKIRGKANVPDNVTGNPEVHVRLRILPGGEVLEASVVRSSGNRAYDSAIERAIRSASPLPVPPPDSELFPQFRDLILHIRHER
jgi:colicin import membrane protein